jgi:hypothetical protein
MSGSVGLSPSRNRKLEGSTLIGSAQNLRKECTGLVAGQAVLTAETKKADFIRHLTSCTAAEAAPEPAERLLGA